jgi:antirestriction protein ArdC
VSVPEPGLGRCTDGHVRLSFNQTLWRKTWTASKSYFEAGPIERLEAVDRFVEATGARIEQAANVPSTVTDHIQMPDEALFCGTDTMTRNEGYYATVTHDLTHWSGAPKRLGRGMGKRFGDAAYAAEESLKSLPPSFAASLRSRRILAPTTPSIWRNGSS